MKVICISGKARHGKDTTAELIENICKKNKKSVLIIHYGDRLKDICIRYFHWNGMKDVSGRTLLQSVGTKFRNYNENFWVNSIIDVLKQYDGFWDYVLIPDCRYENEIELMKKNFNCTSIRVNRPDFNNMLTTKQKNHPSETSLDTYEFDYILNNTSISELEGQIKDVLYKEGL